MINTAGISLYVFGNKKNGDIAQGMIEEYEISNSLGLISLPIKSTGGASAKIYDELIKQNLSEKQTQALKLVGQDFDGVKKIVQAILEAVNLLNEEE